MSAEVIPPSNDGSNNSGKVAVIRRGKEPEVYNPDPDNLPKQLSPAIRYAIFHAVNDTMTTSREARGWVAEIKERHPDAHVIADETTTYTIQATETRSLLAILFGLQPDVSLSFTKTSRPHYEVE